MTYEIHVRYAVGFRIYGTSSEAVRAAEAEYGKSGNFVAVERVFCVKRKGCSRTIILLPSHAEAVEWVKKNYDNFSGNV